MLRFLSLCLSLGFNFQCCCSPFNQTKYINSGIASCAHTVYTVYIDFLVLVLSLFQFLFKHVDSINKAMIIDLDAHQVSTFNLNSWNIQCVYIIKCNTL